MTSSPPSPIPPLTPAQQRYLDEARARPGRTYNGRARRPLETLERLGLVTLEWDSLPQAKGGGMELVQRVTVTPTTSS